MKKLIIILFLILPTMLICQVIKINYLSNITKLSKDCGKTWISNEKYGPVVIFSRLDGNSKISYDYGITWQILSKNLNQNNLPLTLYLKGNILEIPFDIVENKNSIISVYNIKSEPILKIDSKEYQIINNKILLNINTFHSGLYFIFIKKAGSISYIGKFIYAK